MQLKEITHCRLAMFAFSGVVTQVRLPLPMVCLSTCPSAVLRVHKSVLAFAPVSALVCVACLVVCVGTRVRLVCVYPNASLPCDLFSTIVAATSPITGAP